MVITRIAMLIMLFRSSPRKSERRQTHTISGKMYLPYTCCWI